MEGQSIVSMLKSPQARATLSWLLSWYIRMALRTQLSLRIEGLENLRLMTGEQPVIVAFWHEALPTMPILWRIARGQGMVRQAAVLVSRHRDGQMIGSIMRRLGLGLVSGSSSKGGVASMRELVKNLQEGMSIGLTPDGPRGPARRAAAGVAALAGLSGAQILPCGAATTRYVIIKKSWDRMRIPLPFGHMVLVCGAPVVVPRDAWRDALPGIEAALNEAQAQAMS